MKGIDQLTLFLLVWGLEIEGERQREAHSVLALLFKVLKLKETDTETLSLFPIAFSGLDAGRIQ